MKAIQYDVTETNTHLLVPDFHIRSNRGYAYEADDYFVHFYGNKSAFYGVFTGQTFLDIKNDLTLEEWVIKMFGASNIQIMNTNVGETTAGVWRPGLYYDVDIYQALQTTENERRLSEQSLRILLEKLDKIFLYIEPSPKALDIHGHFIRELLILASTEVENFWTQFMNDANAKPSRKVFNTSDYVKLVNKLYLKEFTCTFRSHPEIPPVSPFDNWNVVKPTESLRWYSAYKHTKHNRKLNFAEATFGNALQAVIACLVLNMVKFGPMMMLNESNQFNGLVNQHFKFELKDPDVNSFYIPKLLIPSNYRKGEILYDSKRDVQAFVVNKLIV